jgi:hypothetical protein
MKFNNITYGQYLDLEDKSEIDFAIKYMLPKDYFNVGDFTELKFGLIKDIMFDVSKGLSFETFIDYFEKITTVKLKDAKVLELFGFHKYLISEIERIAKIENNGLSYSPTDEEIRAGIDIFEKYSYYPQLRSIAIAFYMTIDEVRELKYSHCFTELMYQHDMAYFNRRLNEIFNLKNR